MKQQLSRVANVVRNWPSAAPPRDIDVCDRSQWPGYLVSVRLCFPAVIFGSYRSVIGVMGKEAGVNGAHVTDGCVTQSH